MSADWRRPANPGGAFSWPGGAQISPLDSRPTLPDEPFKELSIELYGAADCPPRDEWLRCRAAEGLFEPASVIICAFGYPADAPGKRNLARYACLRDYHAVVRTLLEALAERLNARFPGQYRPFVDASPFPEKRLAARAGLGVIGDNTLLLTQRYGSYVVLGELATDLPFRPTGDGSIRGCSHCGRCRAACPGRALDNGFDAARCASAISQKKGVLTSEEADILRRSGCAWGCDLCQEVCPYNASPAISPLAERFLPAEPLLTPENAERLRETRAFGWRPLSALERNLRILDENGK